MVAKLIYIYLVSLLFCSGTKPIVINIGRGEGFRYLKGICQKGTRSHMQMMVNLLSFDDYRVVLLKEWFFGGKVDDTQKTYKFMVDGKEIRLSSFPYFNGMYTYSPTFLAVFKKKVEWEYITSDSCKNDFVLKYTGEGLYLLKLGTRAHIESCNIMRFDSVTVELSPLYQTKNRVMFLLRVENAVRDSIKIAISCEGRPLKDRFIESGEVYLGIMDNKHYCFQIGILDLYLPEALKSRG